MATEIEISVEGIVPPNGIVTAPAGTTNEHWSILVSPRKIGKLDASSNFDNAIVKMEVSVTDDGETGWAVEAHVWFTNGLQQNGGPVFKLPTTTQQFAYVLVRKRLTLTIS